ncbi:MAG: hypothetical protein HOD60_07460 [Candidatus Nitrosopelagicus sp.]|nr:hypothetical protein [Candidatus Nitrosopelagicus sp.]
MPIQCRTGCQEQVNIEHCPFSDGFVYLLPINLDDSIHDCKNLRQSHDVKGQVSSEQGKIVKTFDMDLWSPDEIEFQKISQEKSNDPNNADKLSKLFKNTPNLYAFEYDGLLVGKDVSLKERLLNAQMRCIMFPTPFLSNPSFMGFSDIVDLSITYELLGDFESAIRSRMIQEKITHDQTEKILELVKKQNDFKKTDDELIIEFNLSSKELRDKYYRKVENVIKSFIRKKYTNMLDFKNDFPTLYNQANNLREKSTEHIERTHDDVIEYLSFGNCVKILKDKKNKHQKQPWQEIEYNIINSAYYVVDRRNDIDHYSDNDLDTHIPKNTKILGYLYSKDIIDFFEKLDYV